MCIWWPFPFGITRKNHVLFGLGYLLKSYLSAARTRIDPCGSSTQGGGKKGKVLLTRSERKALVSPILVSTTLFYFILCRLLLL